MDRPRRVRIARALGAAAWLLIAFAISLGAAGFATAADPQATGFARPELTADADARAQARIVALQPTLQALSGEMDRLGASSRQALVDLVARRDDLLKGDLAAGDVLAGSVAARSAALDAAVTALPSPADQEFLGQAIRGRIAAAQAASASVAQVADDWQRLSQGVLPAIGLADVLAEHDRLTFAATQDGVKGRYQDALAKLVAAGAQLDVARATRDRFAGAADVSTLTQWIDRAAGYDASLQVLYRALAASHGTVTADVKKALAATSQAQALLPTDTRALVVIMGDLARAGLNQAAIAIELARGDLAAAVAALH